MDPNADYLTKRITEHAVSFIERNKNEPFFLYVPTRFHISHLRGTAVHERRDEGNH